MLKAANVIIFKTLFISISTCKDKNAMLVLSIKSHSFAVGDIPGPRNIYKSERRSQSREEINSIGDNSTNLVPGKKTLSRSISVLSPWRPRHNKEDRTIHYDSGTDMKCI